MPSEQMNEVIRLMRDQPGVGSASVSLEERRRLFDETQSSLQVPDDVEMDDVDADGVPAKWFCAPGVRQDVVILYFHGGGYVMGSIDTHQELMSRLSRECGAMVLGVDYRLAPEAKFPVAVDDAVSSYGWSKK